MVRSTDQAAATLRAVKANRLSVEEAYQRLSRSAGTTAARPELASDEDIAVIAMAGRFPGANSVAELWRNLVDGKDSVTEMPRDRWPLPGLYSQEPEAGQSNSKWGGFLDDVAGFDPQFFGLSRREAVHMDPQQRVFLMEAWRALEEAGYSGSALDGRSVGLFVGTAGNGYADLLRDAGRLYNPFAFMGNAASILASRVSYLLNLRGPAIAVETACSSSLVALHLACESLRRGETEMALAGGAYVMVTPQLYQLATSAGMLSPTGRCRAFGAEADGFVPAETVAVVVLKRLADAEADGDTILAVIAGSGTNQDGRTSGITAPNAHSQTALVRDVHERFAIDSAKIGYVETHGTGTSLGDPIEVEGLRNAFASRDPQAPHCYLGSIKSNIGHAQLSAGIAGFVKLVAAIRNGFIPASLHADQLNPMLPLDGGPLEIACEGRIWPKPLGGSRHGAVSAFGFSGTNAHVVVREYAAAPAHADSLPVSLLLVSGRDDADLTARCDALAEMLAKNTDIDVADAAFTLMTGRKMLECRRAIVAVDRVDAIRQLRAARRPSGSPSFLDEDQIASVLALLPKTLADVRPSFAKALEVLGKAFIKGREPDDRWQGVFLDRAMRRVALPTTVFREERFWAGPSLSQSEPDLDRGLDRQWRLCSVFSSTDDLADSHRVSGRPVYPGAALIAAFLEAEGVRGLRGLEFAAPLFGRTGEEVVLYRSAQKGGAVALGDGDEKIYLIAEPLSPAKAGSMPANPSISTISGEPVSSDDLYRRYDKAGLCYGASLRGLRDIIRARGLVQAVIDVPSPVTARPGASVACAEALDMAFQCVGALMEPTAAMMLMVPRALQAVTVYGTLGGEAHVTLRQTSSEPLSEGVTVDVWIGDAAGRTCIVAEGLSFVPVSKAAGREEEIQSREPEGEALVYEPRWLATEEPPMAVAECSGLEILSEPDCLSRAIEEVRGGCRRFVQFHPVDAVVGTAMRGFWASACREYPDLAVVMVGHDEAFDFDLPDMASRVFGLAEPGAVVALRSEGDGWLRRTLCLVDSPNASPRRAPFAVGDVVLVSGGSGGIGREVCRHLSEDFGCTAIALSRSAVTGTSRKIGAGRVVEWACDVRDAAAVEVAIEEIRSQFGRIVGVIHGAGVARDCLIADLVGSETRAGEDAKIAGAVHLAAATVVDEPDVFVLFGGLVAETGNRGQALYGYANAFLADFAEGNPKRRYIGWPLWADGGMRMPADVLENLTRTTGLQAMPTDVGLQLLDQVLASDRPTSVIAFGEAGKLAAVMSSTAIDTTAEDAPAGPEIAELRRALAASVLRMVADCVAIDQDALSEDMAIADLGLESISIMGLKDDFQNAFGVSFSPPVFFEFKTVGTMIDRMLHDGGTALAGRLGVSVAPAKTQPVARTSTNFRSPKAAVKPVLVPVSGTRGASIAARDTELQEIAVVGLDCRFPKAPDVDTFWRNLHNGVDGIGPIPAGRREEWDDLPPETRRQAAMGWGGFLDRVSNFDAAFFGISPAEAKLMDPQQRLLLETVWRALENAGYGPKTLAGRPIGVFVGCAGYDYANVIRRAGAAIEAFTPTGISPSLLANRLSHVFDFTGPSETVDTACASSLVALDHAVRAIRSGACEEAIVAAANVILVPDLHQAFCRAGLLSPSGACRSFDSEADGYVRSEGVAAVVLKPLAQARADGDEILGRILSSAVNHGGRASSLTAPNPVQQAAVIVQAWQDAGVSPDRIDYIEAHGTGTRLGDPVEISGLKMALSSPSWGRDGENETRPLRSDPIIVGAVKSAIGHCEAVAGLAGFIKALNVVRTGQVPANLHLDHVNPHIDLTGTDIRLADQACRFDGAIRIAGVSSFGFGGTNAHVVLASEPVSVEQPSSAPTTRATVIPLSARTPDDLRGRARDLLAWLDRHRAAEPDRESNQGEDADVDRDRTALCAQVAERVSHLTAIPASAINPRESFAELGLDGHQLRRLGQDLSAVLGRSLARDLISVESSLDTLVDHLTAPRPTATVPVGRSVQQPDLDDIAYTLQVGRDAMACRHAFICSSVDDFRRGLLSIIENDDLGGRRVKTVPGSIHTLLSGPRARSLIKAMVEDGELSALAELWTDGLDVPWEVLRHDDDPGRRIALPAYRFDGPSYWVDDQTPIDGSSRTGNKLTYLRPCWQPIAAGSTHDRTTIELLPDEPLSVILQRVVSDMCEGRAPVYRVASRTSAMAVAAVLRSAGAEGRRDCGLVLWDETGEACGPLPVVRSGAVLRRQRDGFEALGLERVVLESDAAPDCGRIVILGGAGGLGLTLARHLARRTGIKLLLIGRRERDGAIDDALMELRRRGTEVAYRALDISDEARLVDALTVAEREWGAIDLVVHCGGAQDDRLLADIDPSMIDRVLAAKVAGTEALRTAVSQVALRPRVVAFSSLAGWFGNPGQTIYAAANAYQDAVALDESDWQSIAWPLWDGIGMAPPEAEMARLARETGLMPLPEAEGLTAFDQVLASLEPCVAVAFGESEAPALGRLTLGPTDPAGDEPGSTARAIAGDGGEMIMAALDADALPDDDETLTDIGFNSLTAARLGQALKDRTAVDLPLNRLVECGTVGQLRGLLDQTIAAEDEPAPDVQNPNLTGDRVAAHAISTRQLPIWRHHLLAPEGYAYNMPVLLRLAPSTDPDRLKEALSGVVDRHESLHCCFAAEEGGAVVRQLVSKRPAMRRTAIPAGMSDDEVRLWFRDLARQPFDLTYELPYRFHFIPDWQGRPHLLCVFHHIAVDGLSLRILLSEIERLYAGHDLGSLDACLSDFEISVAEYRGGAQAEIDRAYWAAALDRDVVPLDLPSKGKRTASLVPGRTRTLGRRLDPALRGGLSLAGAPVGQLFTTMATAWAWTLSTCVDDRFVGLVVPFAGRHESRFQEVVGCLMNPVILRVDFEQNQGFDEARAAFSEAFDRARAHERLALSDTLEAASRPARRATVASKAQAAFYFQNWQGPRTKPDDDLRRTVLGYERLDLIHHEGEFPLTMEVVDEGDQLVLNLKIDADYCDDATAALLLARYEAVLRAVASGAAPPVVPVTPEDDAVSQAWRSATIEALPRETVYEAVMRRAAQGGGDLAVKCGDEVRCYDALCEEVGRLSAGLAAAGVSRGDVVAVTLERCAALPSVLLALMARGAVYLPLDPDFPAERNRFYVDDSGARFIVGANDDRRLAGTRATFLRLEDLQANDRPPPSPTAVEPVDAAYIIYTSGSTGTPKGVVISHGALSNFIRSMAVCPGLEKTDRLLALTTVAFDISGLEIFLPLTQGAGVVLTTGLESKDPYRLWQLIDENRVSVVQATPSTWRLLVHANKKACRLSRILVGGETLPADLATTLHTMADEVFNLYGPTETTIWSTCAKVEIRERVHIGKAIDNTLLRVVDGDGQDCPVGVAGELWIGGHGVAREYWQRPELTGERFVHAARQADGADARFYRTGDLARFLADGDLQHLGRLDGQVKRNGFRIETGEVEAVIMGRLGFKDCAVSLHQPEGESPRLSAFVVPADGDRAIDRQACQTSLRALLPEYMIPDLWRTVPALPMTNNNKVDRKALNALLDADEPVTAAPALPLETAGSELAALAAAIVKRDPADLDPTTPLNLQGFDSMAIVRLTEALNAAHGTDLTPVDLFNAPTLSEIGALVAQEGSTLDKDAELPTPATGRLADAGMPLETILDSDVAIIGMSGAVPGADTLDAFWENLQAGRESTRVALADRWQGSGLDPDDVAAARERRAGFLTGIDLFDAGFFGMTAQEAASTDPQQRLFTLHSWRALEDAGIDPERVRGQAVGVYAGVALGDYHRLLERADGYTAFSMIGMSPSIIPARIAFQLDLKGPAEAVDTACSSSLVSVNNAVKAIAAGEVSMALAGGVYLMTTPLGHIISSRAGILALDGRCKPFDVSADGIVIGEAVGVLVLKSLRQAIRDGDPIRAVIRGTAVNQDGRTNGITAPSSGAQSDLIRKALVPADLPPESIGFVECHGTGTRLGDPIEIEGLRRGLTGDDADGTTPCYLGSVKANVGHCYQAAGIVGMMKTVLTLEHKRLIGQPGFGATNPLLKLDRGRFRVLTENRDWPAAPGSVRRAGVSAFGFSGTNAHVVLEEWPHSRPADRPVRHRPLDLKSYWAAPLDPPAAEVPATSQPVFAPSDDGSGVAEAKALILQEFAGLSGLDVTEIDADANLEADVGMDSIKLMGLVARLSRMEGVAKIEAGDLARITTVGEMLAAIGAGPARPAKAEPARSLPLEPDRLPVPIPYAGYLFLLGHHLIRSSSLCSWVRLEGALDVDRLRRAWQLVVDRQPGCRLVFNTTGDAGTFSDYQGQLLKRAVVPEIALTDLSDEPPASQEELLQAAFDSALNAEWLLDTWPLHRFDLYRLGAGEHALFLVNEHCVSDGIGNQRLLAMVLRAYQALAADSSSVADVVPLVGDDEFADLMRRFNAATDRLRDGKGLSGENVPYFWNPAARQIASYQPDFVAEVVVRSPDETAALEVAATGLGLSMNQLLVLAMARAVHATSGDDRVSLQMPTGGRALEDLDVHDLVCCLAQNLPLDFEHDLLTSAWPTSARGFAEQVSSILAAEADWHVTRAMAEAIRDDISLDPDALRGELRPLFRGRLRSNVYVPYIGDTGISPSYDDLKVTAYRAGTVNGPATIDVLHEIFDGRLHGSWNHDRGFFTTAEMAGLRHAFDAELAAACEAAPSGGGGKAAVAPATDPVLPDVLAQAAEDLLGRQLALGEAEVSMDGALGFDSLKRIRLLTRLPAAIRGNDRLRARLLSAPSLAAMGALITGEAPAGDILAERAGTTPTFGTPDAPSRAAGAVEYDFTELPIDRIVRQMAETPSALAVTCREGALTYEGLEVQSRRLASALGAEGGVPGDRVGVLMDRSTAFIATVVGIVRTGAAYVPLDPDLPADRLAYIIDHARLKGVICSAELRDLFARVTSDLAAPPPVFVAAELFLHPPKPSGDLPRPGPADPMVVLYTSGSTGRPKGVLLNHAGYANRMAWHQKQFRLQPGEGVLHKTTICFDISVWEIFWPLMYGGVLHTVGPEISRDPWALAQAIRDKRIGVMHFVPSLFGEFLNALAVETPQEPFEDLRWVVLSGEALTVAQARTWFELFGPTSKLANLYGPTEASIDVTCQEVLGPPPEGWNRVPIGVAIDNVELLVLNGDLQPVGPDEDGELFIGGVQLADGYLHARDLTEKAFLTIDPDGRGARRLYRTGDLVRRLPGDVFDHLGRLDSQIKLRGYRIELGEIEAVLAGHPQVRQVAVLVDGEALVAHIAGDADDPQSYLDHCARKLPRYMVPQRVEPHARLPINSNGKLDRGAIARGGDGANTRQVSPLARSDRLLPAQFWLLRHFPAPYRWWGSSRFIVNRDLDRDRIRDSLLALVHRHEALRTVFAQDGDGAWRRDVVPAADVETVDFRFFDARGMSVEAREAWIAETLERACKAYRLDRLPLDTAVVLRLDESRYAFCLANHHINGDFVSGDILFRDFWALYDGRELDPPTHQQGDLAEVLENLASSGDLAADRAYWAQLEAWRGLELYPAIDVTYPNRERDAVSLDRRLLKSETRALSTVGRGLTGSALYPVLAAAFYKAMAELSGRDRAVLSHRMAGRILGEGLPAFADAVGNFAVHYPVGVSVAESFAETVGRVAAALDEVPHGGVTYDGLAAAADDGGPGYPYPDETLTAVRLNYLGQVLPPSDGGFEFAADNLNQRFAPAELPRSAEIEIHLGIEAQELFLRAGFAEGRHDRDQVERLLTRACEILTDISAD